MQGQNANDATVSNIIILFNVHVVGLCSLLSYKAIDVFLFLKIRCIVPQGDSGLQITEAVAVFTSH